MSDGAELVLLQDCHDLVEAAHVRSALEAHAIPFVVQGEHHAALIMGSLGGGPVTPRVLVAARDLVRAQEAISAQPLLGHGDEPALSDSVCPVHEAPAVATCDRCGTFLCNQCPALGKPPLCEDCLGRESAKLEPTTPRQRLLRAQAAFLIPLSVLLALLLLYAFASQGLR
jgi:hypothetical protein